MPPRLARLAGFGALAACAAMAALFVVFVIATRPASSSGLDPTQRFLAWFGVAAVLLALIGLHFLLGRRLLALSRGVAEPV